MVLKAVSKALTTLRRKCMKFKKSQYAVGFILLGCIVAIVYFQINYKTIEDAIEASSVNVDEVYYSTEKDGNKVIIFKDGDTLSVGLVEKKKFLGYRWGFGAGSRHFNVEDEVVTKSFGNLKPSYSESEMDLISFNIGVI